MNKYNLISCVWELTLKCNLRCIHCGSGAGKKREGELTLEEAINLCYDLKKTGCRSVALMGGEPLLSENFYIIAEKLKELSIDISIITNGTIYDDEIFRRLKELNPAVLSTSIDGSKPQTHDRIRGVKGSFEKTMSFIDRALSLNLPVSVITTVSKLNISELNEIKNLIKGRKIAWQIQCVGAEGNRFDRSYLLDSKEFYSVGVFIETMRRIYPVEELPVIGAHDLGYNSCIINNIWLYDRWKGCQAGISVVGIRSNGDVMGCLSLNNDRFIEGNIKKRSLYDIWNDEKSFAYTRNFKREDAGENCKNCKFIDECKGGCSEMSLSLTSTLHNDPYCFYKIEKENMNWFYRKWLKLKSFFYKVHKDRYKLIEIFGGKRI